MKQAMGGWRNGLWGTLLGLLALAGLGCKDLLEAPTNLAYPANPATYTVGTAIPANTPTHGGGAVDTYTVSPSLPGGIALDAKTGTLSGTPTAVATAATYTVTATNGAGSATASLSITVAAPTLAITTQPASQTLLVGTTATFTVAAAGTGTLSYQWWRNGTAIADATSASYTTAALAASDTGATFSVVVSDTYGSSVTSAEAVLTVRIPLAIATQPASVTVVEGAAATFTVGASGTGTFTYQWRRDGTAITGATGASYTTPATVLADTGAVYSVVVSDTYGASVTSADATLTVQASVQAGTFSATGSMTAGRFLHTATLLADGQVLVAGGYLASPVQSYELYNPTSATFTAGGSLVTARYGHTATLLANGLVLLAGGYTYGAPTATAELYDPATGTTTSTGSLNQARVYHSATLLADGKVLVSSGRDSTSILRSAEVYDPVTGTFTATSGIPVGFRYSHLATLLANGKVLLAGGYGSSILATAELYDPATGTFSATGGMAHARYWHTAIRLTNGKVLVAGGAATTNVELYDPAAGTFSLATGTLSSNRYAHTATLLPSGVVLLAGGKSTEPTANGSILNTAELYNPVSELFVTLGTLAQGRYYHAAVALSDGKVLLTGGVGGSYTAAEIYH